MKPIYPTRHPLAGLLTLLLALLLPLAGWGQTTITYWNFNSGGTGTAPQAWPSPVAATAGSGTLTHNLSATASFGGTTTNQEGTDLAGNSFAPQGGAATLDNNGRQIVLSMSTVGYAGVVLTYASRGTSSGFDTHVVDYTTDGMTYTTLTTFTGRNATSFSTLTADFSAIAAADNNANFAVRITVSGATSTSGNNRFDNIRLRGTVAANNPAPTISSLAPSSATAGAAAQTVTINGTGLLATSVANFNGAARVTTFVSATEITIDLTAADLASAGAQSITVTNPAPGGGTSAAATFTVNPPSATNPVPVISSLAPGSATAGAAAQVLTINGTGYQATSTVSFDGTSRPVTFISNIELTINLTAADLATAGPRNVIVTNQAPGGGDSNTAVFTVNPQPAPTLTGINPSSIPAGQTTTVTFTGTDFQSGATVNFNGMSVATTFGSSTSLTADLAAPAATMPATFAVSVTTGGGTSGPQTLTVTVPAPIPSVSIAAMNTAYTEQFDSLATTGSANSSGTLPRGWTFREADSGGNTSYRADDGGSTSGDTYSYGSTGSTDRGLGTLASGSVQSTIGAAYTNNTGTAITSLLISYAGELWRLGTAGRADELAFSYSEGGGTFATAAYTLYPALSLQTPNQTGSAGTRNGNLPANRTLLSSTIAGLNIAPGATFFIQWVDSNISGSDDGLAVDEFSLTANPAMGPTSLTVANGQNLTASGAYTTITVQSGGTLTLTGPTSATGAVSLQTGGLLNSGCQVLSGTGSFTMQAGSELQICDAAGISLNGATGSIQLTGTRSFASDASYTYNGTVAQVTGAGLPATVRNLTVNNAAGLSLSTAQRIAQVLRLQSGNLNTSAQDVILLSDANGTALIDNAGGVVVGTGTMQRAITSAVGGPAYRHLSSPVANTTLNDLTTPGFAPAFNTAYNTSPTPGTVTPFPTVFGYDESRVGTVTSNYNAFDQGFFSPTAGADVMVPTRGYTVNTPATVPPIDFVGTFNNAAQNSGALARSTNAQSGWHLLGNPYPAPLDWSTVAPAQRPGLDAAMYVYQSTSQYAGTYRSFANGIGTSPLIDAGSGYFVRTSVAGTPGAVNLTNANRVTTFGQQPAFGRGTADLRPQIRLALSGTGGLSDDAYVYFQTGATAGFDPQYDATKLTNPSGLNLSSVIAGPQELAINGLPLLNTTAPLLVPLNIGVPAFGTYMLQVASLLNFSSAVTLIDGLTGTRTLLAPGTNYSFAMSATYTAPGRFTLEFAPAAAPLATAGPVLAAQVQLYPNPASASFRVTLPALASATPVQLTLSNALGQNVVRRTLAAPAGQRFSTEVDVRGLAAGVYALRLSVAGATVIRKVVVE